MDNSKLILYEDDTVRINRDQITILQYFYPIPMDKFINMKDIQCVNLKFDVDRHQQYIEVIVKGFSLNATFSPNQPNKVISIIQTNISLLKARQTLDGQKTQKTTLGSTKIYGNKQQERYLKGDIKKQFAQTSQNVKRQDFPTKQIGVIGAVTATLAEGWETVKEGTHHLYEMTTSPQSQDISHQADRLYQQGSRLVKQGTQKMKQAASMRLQQRKQEAKNVYQNTKQKASESWQNVKQGAQNVYDRSARKVGQLAPEIPQQAKMKAKSAKQNIKQGTSQAVDSAKIATGYEESKLQQEKQNVYQGVQSKKKGIQKTYEKASDKSGQIGSDIKKKTGQQTKKAGQALKEKGNQMQK